MNSEQVTKYVQTQVQAAADRKILPVVEAIKSEIAQQAENNASIVALTEKVAKLNKESNERVAKLQSELVKANTEVNALSVKLGEAVAGAASNGATTANA